MRAARVRFNCVSCGVGLNLGAHCSCCERRIATQSGPIYIPLRRSDEMYAAVEKAFHSGWHHPVYHPPWVIAIHAILPSEQASAQYEAVRFSNVSSKESRLYHGTKVECDFPPSRKRLCASPTCSLCRIVEGGFRLPRPGHAKPVNPNGWDRFGRAIYTTPVSSKAADYERKRNPCKNIAKRDRHVLVARVATGRMHNLLTGEPNRRGARQGYDSIIAPAGFSVNYTEHAVYKDYGALPNFVITFRGGF